MTLKVSLKDLGVCMFVEIANLLHDAAKENPDAKGIAGIAKPVCYAFASLFEEAYDMAEDI